MIRLAFVHSIQFSLFCIAHYQTLQICLKELYNLYTYDIPVPGPHIGSEKTLKKYNKSFQREKREETFRRATEEDPSPGWTEQ